MGFGEGQHKLNIEQTQEMEGIAYNLTGEENLEEGKKPSFKILRY